MEMVGRVSRALGFAIEPVILKTTRQYLEDLRRDCEAAAKAEAQSQRVEVQTLDSAHPINLRRHDEVTLGEAVDFVRPQSDFGFTP